MVKRRKDDKNRVLKEGEHQRTNGTYEYKWRDKRGLRHSVYAKTLSELREKEINVLRDILDGIGQDGGSITINDLYERWRQIKRGLKPNTFQNYCFLFERHVYRDFGMMRITDLKRTDVKALYISLKEDKGLKTSTVDDVHTVLHQVIEIAVEDNYIRFNPADNAMKEVKRSYGDDAEKCKALTIDQQEMLESYLKTQPKHHRWYPLIITMLWTGMRVGEITGLRWCDVDMEKNIIDVNHTILYYMDGSSRKCRMIVNSPKTKCSRRSIPMLPIVKDAILMEKEMQKKYGIECKTNVDGYTDFIFLNRYGNAHNHSALNMLLGRIVESCNAYALCNKRGEDEVILLPQFSNHTLRHTFTTRMCEAGMNIKAMQDILGHADAETTMNIYAEATQELKQSEMINLADFFPNASKGM